MRFCSLTFALTMLGCSVGELPFADKRCPCATGFVCVGERCEPRRDADVAVDMTVDLDAMVDRDADVIVEEDADTAVVPDADVIPDMEVPDTVPDMELPLPSYCDSNTPLLCEDFDSIAEWSLDSRPGVTIELDTTRVYRGSSSLRVDVIDQGARRTMIQELPSSVRGQTIYARTYVYLEDVTYQNVTWLTMREEEEPFAAISGKFREEGAGYRVHTEPQRSGGPVPRQDWVCWQIESKLASDGTGDITITVDGEIVVQGLNLNTEPAGGIELVAIGAGFSNEAGPRTFWVDELVVDTSPIPCD